MKKKNYFLVMILIIVSSQIVGQTKTDQLLGKWKTEDKAIIEFFRSGKIILIKQIDAEQEKDKKYNGKTIGKDVLYASGLEFRGIVIDPSNGKEYKGTWILTADGKSLKLKVKWGLLNFSETWTRQ